MARKKIVQRRPAKSFLALTNAEKDEAVRQFDEEFVIDRSRPLTAAERREWKHLTRRK